jgi:hypothetical protein
MITSPIRPVPGFLIVGAARAGTTTLFQRLSIHPEVFLPAHKEPSFFYFWGDQHRSAEACRDRYVTTPDQYEALFRSARPDQIVGEASTVYLHRSDVVIPNIQRAFGAPSAAIKILVALREPVSRAWSMYTRMIQTGRESLSFDYAMAPETITHRARTQNLGNGFDYVGGSHYFRTLGHYFNVFQNVHVLMYEDITLNQDAAIKDVCSFLGVSAPVTARTPIHANASGTTKNDAWGTLYRLQGSPAGTAAKKVLRRILPRSALIHAKNLLTTRAISRPLFDPERYYPRFGPVFAEDLTHVVSLLEDRNLTRQAQVVRSWLDKYSSPLE